MLSLGELGWLVGTEEDRGKVSFCSISMKSVRGIESFIKCVNYSSSVVQDNLSVVKNFPPNMLQLLEAVKKGEYKSNALTPARVKLFDVLTSKEIPCVGMGSMSLFSPNKTPNKRLRIFGFNGAVTVTSTPAVSFDGSSIKNNCKNNIKNILTEGDNIVSIYSLYDSLDSVLLYLKSIFSCDITSETIKEFKGNEDYSSAYNLTVVSLSGISTPICITTLNEHTEKEITLDIEKVNQEMVLKILSNEDELILHIREILQYYETKGHIDLKEYTAVEFYDNDDFKVNAVVNMDIGDMNVAIQGFHVESNCQDFIANPIGSAQIVRHE